jgi:hypothetical protein
MANTQPDRVKDQREDEKLQDALRVHVGEIEEPARQGIEVHGPNWIAVSNAGYENAYALGVVALLRAIADRIEKDGREIVINSFRLFDEDENGAMVATVMYSN